MTARLLLPDFRSPVGYEDRFAGRLFRVVYTSQANRRRVVLPPPQVGPFTFREAAAVVLDVRGRFRAVSPPARAIRG